MRSAKDDLALCNKATPGPWRVKTNAHRATRGGSWGWIEGPRENWCWADERPRSRRDADFIAMAREALPYWIKRAERLERALGKAVKYDEDDPHCRECDCLNCVYFYRNSGDCRDACEECDGESHVRGCAMFGDLE